MVSQEQTKKKRVPVMSITKLLHKPDQAKKEHLDALLDEAPQEIIPASDATVDVDTPGPDTRPRAELRAIHAQHAGHRQLND
jgi:hypothetical protein